MTNQYLYIFGFLIFICQCTPKKPPLIVNDCEKQVSKTINVQFDSLKIKSGDDFNRTQTFEDRYLITQKRGKLQLEIFDLRKQKYLRTIHFDKNVIAFGSFFVHNLDSIFIAKEFEILLIDSNGKLRNKWKVDKAPINWEVSRKFAGNAPLYYLETDNQSINGFDAVTGKLFLTVTNPDIWFFEDRENFKLHGVFNINTQKWELMYGLLPEIYATKGEQEWIYPSFLSFPSSLIKGDSTIISFPMCNSIHVFNNRTGKIIAKKCANSSYVGKLNSPIAYQSDMQEQTNLVFESGYYGSVSYHKNIDLFSRIAVCSQKLKNKDGTLRNIQKKQVSAIFFDKNFNQVGEYLLDENSKLGSFGNYQTLLDACSTSDGFLCTNKKSYQKEGYLPFSSILKVKLKK